MQKLADLSTKLCGDGLKQIPWSLFSANFNLVIGYRVGHLTMVKSLRNRLSYNFSKLGIHLRAKIEEMTGLYQSGVCCRRKPKLHFPVEATTVMY